MIARTNESLISELLTVLDEELELLATKRSLLSDLSEALIGRNDEDTERLLEQIEQSEQAQASLDMRLKAVRESLADVFGCDARDLRLSRLVAELPDDQARKVDSRRRKMTGQVEALRRQHLQTVLMLAECARINRMLLDSMLPAGETVTTYDAAGMNNWRSGAGLVDKEL